MHKCSDLLFPFYTRVFNFWAIEMKFIQWTEEKIRRTADRTTSNNELIIYNLPPPPCPHVVRYRVTGTCRLKTFQITQLSPQFI